MHIYKKSKLHTFVFLCISCIPLYSNNYPYDLFDKNPPKQNNHSFMHEDFDEIIRFDAIPFKNPSFSKHDLQTLDAITAKAKLYQKESKLVAIEIIGHASESWKEQSDTKSQDYALQVESYFKESNISDSIITKSHRGSKDKAYLSIKEDQKSLNNRVMVSMYVKLPKDLDQDGVNSDIDQCPDTKPNVKVGSDGCKLKTMIILLEGKKENSSIIVSTKKGSQVVNVANQLVSIQSENKKPSQPVKIDIDEMQKMIKDTDTNKNFQELTFTMYFDGKALSKESQTTMQKVLSELNLRKNAYVNIIGHTDTLGTPAQNKTLGFKRAQSIVDIIKDSGPSYLKIDTDSYSEHNLKVQTQDETFEPLNRRVEIFIH